MSLITELVGQLLVIYRREPDAAARCLDFVMYEDDLISDLEADKISRSAVNRSRKDLERRTLIDTRKIKKPDLKSKLAKETRTNAEILRELLELQAIQPHEENQPPPVANVDYRERLLSFFLEKLDSMAEVVSTFDESEDLTQISSETVRAILREANTNFLLGMDQGAVILFWAAIECALFELLDAQNIKSLTVAEALDSAEAHLGLENALRVQAEQVYELRIKAVHKPMEFKKSHPLETGNAMIKARKAIVALYGSKGQ